MILNIFNIDAERKMDFDHSLVARATPGGRKFAAAQVLVVALFLKCCDTSPSISESHTLLGRSAPGLPMRNDLVSDNLLCMAVNA